LKSDQKIFWLKITAALACFLLFVAGYTLLFADNVRDLPGSKTSVLYIHTGYTYDSVITMIKRERVLKNVRSFSLLAEKLQYRSHVRPGRYVIGNKSGNLFIIRKLRSGRQDPVNITFNNVQSKEQLAEKISARLEATTEELLQQFGNRQFLDSLNLTEENFPTIFLANTYEFYWNTSASEFIHRMLKEYSKFWNHERRQKAASLGLSSTDIIILASIIQKESNHYDEYPAIAGVYLNRLNKGMPLQADPTIMYAQHLLGLKKRVYKNDLQIDSPYNTYTHRGLPPGPICLPEMKSIDQTLNAEEHHYLYFCAREDFSGYHAFAETWNQHLENARRYQKALDDRNIR
jgi:UPF0755 protein